MPTSTATQLEPPHPTLPKPFTYTTPPPVLHYQGAEALLYRTTFLFPETSLEEDEREKGVSSETSSPPTRLKCEPIPAALKYRPSKPYRHPLLDAKLTRARILSEARVLAKLRREGVNVPGVLAVDWPAAGDVTASGGWMLMEWVEGETVRKLLDRETDTASVEFSGSANDGGNEKALMRLMGSVGRLVGRVHELGVVHGDLTTSNLMVRHIEALESAHGTSGSVLPVEEGEKKPEEGERDVVVVDFGLAFQSSQDEDRAVDLYVLERAFGSSHPRTERLFGEILRAYGESFRSGKVVLKKLEEVRMRGRKKILIG